jgi:hypothetical protein
MLNTPTKELTQEAQIFDGYREIVSAIHEVLCRAIRELLLGGGRSKRLLLCQVVSLTRLALGSIVVLIRFSELLRPRVLLSSSEAARC